MCLERLWQTWGLEIFKDMNLETLPWLKMPRNLGTAFHIRPAIGSEPALTCKIKMLGGVCSTENALRGHLKDGAKAWGFMQKPRNHYFLDTLRFYFTDYGPIKWKVYFAVMPRSWRKRVWKSRRFHGA